MGITIDVNSPRILTPLQSTSPTRTSLFEVLPICVHLCSGACPERSRGVVPNLSNSQARARSH